MRGWQVAAGLIYGQVKKSYRRRKLVQVTPVMRLGTEETLKAALQALGFSGRLNTAFIERVNLTVRNARGGSGKTNLGHFSTSAPVAGPSGMVARVLPFCPSPCLPAHDARAAARTRGEAASATLSSADPSHGRRENDPTMDGARSALVPLAPAFRLRGSQARWWAVSRRGVTGEDTHRRAHMESHSWKRRPL